jgi:AbrB family looped-hinge helix DNA binding protein
MPTRASSRTNAPFTGCLGRRRQITLPKSFCDTVGLHAGDLLEATVKGKKITLAPKSLVDVHLAETLADLRAGRTHGPFDTHEEFLASLHDNARKA